MYKTGDIQKNIEKLNREIKRIQYPNKLPDKLLQSGNPEVYLPIIHYTLFKYSKVVAQFLADNNYNLFAKNDYDFISSAFTALIKLFNYKPCLTLDNFFSKTSAENKVILCCDIIQLIQAKHTELSRKGGKKAKSTPDTKQSKAEYTSNQPNSFPKGKEKNREDSDHDSSPKFNSKGDLGYEEEEYLQQNEYIVNNNNIQYNNANDQIEQFESSQEFSVYNNNSNMNSNPNLKNQIEGNSDQYNQMHQSCKTSQQNAIDFSALVQVINTLSSSVSQMANKVEKFKITIEDRLSKIEAEVSLIKNKQSIFENKYNNLLNSSLNINHSNNNSNNIFTSNKNDDSPSKANDQLFSFSADVHSLDLSNKKDSNDKNDQFFTSPITKLQFSQTTSNNSKYNNNMQHTNYEDTDRLIENVEKKFKETQKLLSEFSS